MPVLVLYARGHLHAAARLCRPLLETQQHGGPVVRMDQLHRVAADELRELVPQQPRGGGAAVEDRAVRPEQGDGVPTLFHERTKASLADAQRRFGGLLVGLTVRKGYGPPDR